MTPCHAVQHHGFHCFDGGFWVMLPLLATCLWTVFLPGHVNSIDESVLQEIRTLGAQAWKRNENTLHNFSSLSQAVDGRFERDRLFPLACQMAI